MGHKKKNSIIVCIFAILFLPLLQGAFPFIKSAPLNGEYTLADDTAFSWRNWFKGSFGKSESNYINDNIGFRPDLVRLYDQVDYSLFKKIHSEWRLLGDRDCIFQDMHIYSYLGRDYDGYPYILEKVRKMKAIQDTLSRLGKSFIFVQTPCKAFYYPEYFPPQFKDVAKGPNNYDAYKRIADSLGLNQVDFNRWFVDMKSSSKELLYPKQGFHWSVYGSLLAADSMVKYIERLRKMRMVHPVWTNIVHTTKARSWDDDIARSINLVFPLTTETFSYPEVHFEGGQAATKPRVIYIGDSFLFQWVDEGIMDNTDRNWQIWYYNRMLINDQLKVADKYPLTDSFEVSEMKKADCIIVMFTSRNLSKMGVDFVEKTYDHFYPGK